MHKLLVLPMAFYFFYIVFIGVINFLTRKRAVQSGELKPGFFKSHNPQIECPERVRLVARHFDNQFEVPPLFFITCLAFLALAQGTEMTLILAWAFVASRIAHSYVHLGGNKILFRAGAYFTGFILLAVMWGQLVYLTI